MWCVADRPAQNTVNIHTMVYNEEGGIYVLSWLFYFKFYRFYDTGFMIIDGYEPILGQGTRHIL